MSSCWLNIRVGYWHLQIGEQSIFNVRIAKNHYLKQVGLKRNGWVMFDFNLYNLIRR